jgi:hypothetical protein
VERKDEIEEMKEEGRIIARRSSNGGRRGPPFNHNFIPIHFMKGGMPFCNFRALQHTLDELSHLH